MKNKIFDPNIEDIYKNLPEAQKDLYLKKYNIQNIVALILVGILVAMDVVGLILILTINEEVPSFAILLVAFMLLCCVGIMFISIKALKSPNEVKVKRFIENLEKRKANLANTHNSQNQSFLDNYFSRKEKQKLNFEEIKFVNNYVNSFLNNSDLITICKNFMQISGLPLNYLEFVFVPLITPENFDTIGVYLAPASSYEFKYPENLAVENSPYIEVLKEFKEDTINVDEATLLLATVIRRAGLTQPYKINLKEKVQEIEEIFEKFNKARDMFYTLCNQGVISCEKNIYQYYAFIFVLYYLDKIRVIDIVKQILKDYSISDNLNLKEFIEVCYSKDLDEETINTLTIFIESDKRSNKPLINKLVKELKPIVHSTIKSIKEKESIERLRTGNFVHRPKYSIAQIDLMNGVEFEDFVTKLFNYLGYQAENTKLSGDQGVDVIAKKGDKIIAIQAKHYNQSVGNHAIMEVVGGAKYYNATLCYVVTNNYFTKSAKELAASNNVILWDRDKLIEKINEI